MDNLRLFAVELTIEAVILATDEVDAERIAHQEKADIMADADPEVHVGADLTLGGRLPSGWTADTYPYPVGNRTIQAIQATARHAAERVEPVDRRTIDMFTGKALIDG